MKKIITLFVCILICTAWNFDYAQNLTWVYHLGGQFEDQFKSITTDGVNFYAGGRLNSTTGISYSEASGLPVGTSLSNGAIVSQFDANGKCTWASRVKDNSGTYLVPNSIVNAVSYYNSRVYITGNYVSSGAKYFYVARFSSAGVQDLNYFFSFNGGEGFGIFANSNGIFAGGSYKSTSAITLTDCTAPYQTLAATSNKKSFILKLTECVSGFEIAWSQYSTNNKDAEAFDLTASPNGSDLYMTGYFGAQNFSTNNISFPGAASISGNAGIDLYTAKFSAADGSCSWIKKAGKTLTGTTNAHYGYHVIAENDAVYVTGKIAAGAMFETTATTNAGAFLARYSSTGSLTYVMDNAPETNRAGYGLALMEDKIYVSGENFYWKANKSDGSFQWGYKINAAATAPVAIAYGIAATPYGEILSAGQSSTSSYDYGNDGGFTGVTFSPYVNSAYKDALLFRVNSGEMILTADFGNITPITADLNGESIVALFKSCDPLTDAPCIDNLVKEQPAVLRFPSAGDARYLIPTLTSYGYGYPVPSTVIDDITTAYRSNMIAPYKTMSLATLYASYSHSEPFTCFTGTYSYNIINSACFSGTNYTSYVAAISPYVCNYNTDQVNHPESALLSLIKMVKDIEDPAINPTWPAGKKVGVIYVANIITGLPSDLTTILGQLEDVTLQAAAGVSVADQ